MNKTIDDFIKELQLISEDKRKLPLVVLCPNGELTSPSIKMMWDDPMQALEKAPDKMIIMEKLSMGKTATELPKSDKFFWLGRLLPFADWQSCMTSDEEWDFYIRGAKLSHYVKPVRL